MLFMKPNPHPYKSKSAPPGAGLVQSFEVCKMPTLPGALLSSKPPKQPNRCGGLRELYNPQTGKFSPTGSLNTGRTDHRTVLLNNGEVLTTGGYDGSGGNIGYLSSAELFH